MAVAEREGRGNDPSQNEFALFKRDRQRQSSLLVSRQVAVLHDLPLLRRRHFERFFATATLTRSIRESGRGVFLVR